MSVVSLTRVRPGNLALTQWGDVFEVAGKEQLFKGSSTHPPIFRIDFVIPFSSKDSIRFPIRNFQYYDNGKGFNGQIAGANIIGICYNTPKDQNP